MPHAAACCLPAARSSSPRKPCWPARSEETLSDDVASVMRTSVNKHINPARLVFANPRDGERWLADMSSRLTRFVPASRPPPLSQHPIRNHRQPRHPAHPRPDRSGKRVPPIRHRQRRRRRTDAGHALLATLHRQGRAQQPVRHPHQPALRLHHPAPLQQRGKHSSITRALATSTLSLGGAQSAAPSSAWRNRWQWV